MLVRRKSNLILSLTILEVFAIDHVLTSNFFRTGKAQNERADAATASEFQRRFTGAGVIERWVRVLDWARMDRTGWDLDVLTVVLDVAILQDFWNEIHALIDHRLQFGEIITERTGFLLCAALAHPKVNSAIRKNIERRNTLCNLHRMVHGRRQADNAVANADTGGPARHVSKEGLRRRHVRILGESGVLDRPHGVEAHFFSKDHLLDDFVKAPAFGFARRISHLRFINQRKFHQPFRPLVRACY